MKILVITDPSDALSGELLRALPEHGHSLRTLQVTDGPAVEGAVHLPGPRRRADARRLTVRRALVQAESAGVAERPDLLLAAGPTALVAAHSLAVVSGAPVLALPGTAAAAAAPHDLLLQRALEDATVLAAQDGSTAQQLQDSILCLPVPVLPTADAAGLLALCEEALQRTGQGVVLFHAPYPLDPRPASASRQRPNRMLAGLERAGYAVLRMLGDPPVRSLAYADLCDRLRAGQHIAFVYSENSTQPNALATSLRAGFAPLLEARLLRLCVAHRIPVGQFYRDVYWRFPESQASAPLLRRLLMQVLYRLDLQVLRRSTAHLFVPSLPMVPVIPFAPERCTALPPGTAVHDSTTPQDLHLLYVGSIGGEYGLTECLRGLWEVEGVRTTLVVPEKAWAAHRAEYEPLLTDRVRVVHAAAHELAPLYDQASACLLMVEPNEYRRFAVPLKMYEYLGYGKPTLASRGTLAGEMVEQLGTGLAIDCDATAIAEAVGRLREHPEELAELTERVRRERHEHTWDERVRTVAEVLGRGDRRR